MSIVWIGEQSSKNASLVGKKAANLSVLNHPQQIPSGFIIPATDFFNEEFTDIVIMVFGYRIMNLFAQLLLVLSSYFYRLVNK